MAEMKTRHRPAHELARQAAVLAYLLLGCAAVQAQSSGDGGSSDELAAKATDPTASLMSFQLNDWYTRSYRDLDGSANQLVLRAAIPFTLGGLPNIFRITQPIYTESPSGKTGAGDTTIFDIAVFGQPWGRLGLGFSGSMPTGRDGLTQDKWTLGPALGFVNSSSKQVNWGLFTQTFFSVGGKDAAPDVGLVNIQPIFSYQLGQGRSLSLGNSALIYDTKASRWNSLMLGANYGQVVSFGGQKWRPNVEVDYDLRDAPGVSKWTFRLGITLLVPSL